MQTDYVAELRNITKDFPGVCALDDVTVKIRPGKVHALVGENGAGKSTLMKILNGLYKPNAGAIVFYGEETVVTSQIDARAKGIAMVYQELNYISELSIEENIFMGRYPDGRLKGTVNWKEVRRQTKEMLAKEGLNYDPSTKIKNLSVSEIQMLEIVKAVSFDAKVIIMDEPASSITKKEVDMLFRRIEDLKQRGIGIVYISHKMDEIFQIADDITVLRDGKVVSTGSVSDYDIDKLISQMVGREIKNIYPKISASITDLMLEVKGLSSTGVFRGINLSVHKGEILGLGGLVGAGRTELARALIGMDPISAGEIILDGKKLISRNICRTMQEGMIMVSEDRREYGIVGCRNITENATLADNCATKGFIAGTRKQMEKVKTLIKRLNVKTPNLDVNVENLSGGNQQKVVLAKWLMLDTKVMILDEPTRGIDVGAKFEIYKIICKLANNGCAIIMISSEIPELMGIADKIKVMCRGRIYKDIPREEFSQELIMRYAVGGIEE
jgi:inositol transport system ATP-binding protein